MSVNPDDRRVRKTRKALRVAVEELLARKPLESISVKELAARAEINRATFYLHYASPRELLLEVAEEYLRQLTQSFKAVEMDNMALDRPPEQMIKVFKHVKAHAAVYRPVLHGAVLSPFHPRIAALFQDLGVRRIQDVKGTSPHARELVDREMVVHGAIGATLGVISWWLQNGMKRSPEYMAERLAWLLISGAYPLLGLKPPQIE